MNTKQVFQDELEALYTGDQISGHNVYAQNYTYLWCVLMFSTGMPIMYPFAFVFYVVLFIVYKFLLIYYYQKTTQFNHELPMLATSYIKVGIILHIVCSALMVTNTDIIPGIKIEPKEGETEDDLSYKFRVRFWSKPHGTIYALFLIGLIIFVFFKNTIMLMIYSIFDYFKSKSTEKDIFADSTQCDDIYREFPVEDLD